MENYYDVDSILASEERVPVTFNCDAVGLGYLGAGSGKEEDIAEGTRMELPFWLADRLIRKKIVSINLPKYYSQKYRNYLKADPQSIDVRSACPVYYTLGMRLAPWLGLDQEGQEALKNDLVEALVERYFSVLDCSQNSKGDDNSDFIKPLTEEERLLFGLSFSSAVDYDKWKNRLHGKLQVSRVMGNIRKKRKVAH
jgi:GINS complex subunit 3